MPNPTTSTPPLGSNPRTAEPSNRWKNGSCGGHNGIRNIIERLGTQDFARLKLGVGKDKSDVIAHVLGKFDPTTRKTMDLVVAEAVKASAAILRDGPDRAMNAYNGFDAAK